jgi:hypothetical protein
VALGQVFSEYFGFPCKSSFHQLLHNHHRSFGAGTMGQHWPTYQVDSISPHPDKIKKKLSWFSQTLQANSRIVPRHLPSKSFPTQSFIINPIILRYIVSLLKASLNNLRRKSQMESCIAYSFFLVSLGGVKLSPLGTSAMLRRRMEKRRYRFTYS